MAVLFVATACVDARIRPSDPTAPEQDPATSNSFVRITQPIEGQSFSRVIFTRSPGFEVTFRGRFRQGEQILMLVFSDEHPNSPVFAAETTIERPGDALFATNILLASETLSEARELEILARILDGNDREVTTDSVGVILR